MLCVCLSLSLPDHWTRVLVFSFPQSKTYTIGFDYTKHLIPTGISTIISPGSLAYRRQIMRLLSLHSHRSQFLIIHIHLCNYISSYILIYIFITLHHLLYRDRDTYIISCCPLSGEPQESSSRFIQRLHHTTQEPALPCLARLSRCQGLHHGYKACEVHNHLPEQNRERAKDVCQLILFLFLLEKQQLLGTPTQQTSLHRLLAEQVTKPTLTSKGPGIARSFNSL